MTRENVEAAHNLSACSFPPFYSREAVEFILGFAEEVAREIPCYELRVVPERSVAEFIIDQI